MNNDNGQMAVAAESEEKAQERERASIAPETWEALRTASIRGVPDNQLAESFGITKNAIQVKRHRDPVWQAAMADNKPNVSSIVREGSQTLSVAQKVASSVSESIAAVGQQNRLLALQIASKGLSRANAAELPILGWSDVKILADITAKLTGLEGGNAVQVNVITDGSGHFSEGDFPAFDVEC